MLYEVLRTEARIAQTLPQCDRPSQIFHTLSSYDAHTLVLVGSRSSRNIRQTLWHHLVEWLPMKLPLDGNDLKRMGYKPGKDFKIILDTVRDAALDGAIATADEAEVLVRSRFPQGE